MKFLCGILGHKWVDDSNYEKDVFNYRRCARCGEREVFVLQSWYSTDNEAAMDLVATVNKWERYHANRR